jgi:hypothetical protein
LQKFSFTGFPHPTYATNYAVSPSFEGNLIFFYVPSSLTNNDSKNLLENTPKEHADYNNLNQALTGISHIVTLANETTGKANNLNKLKQIEAMFGKEATVSTMKLRF